MHHERLYPFWEKVGRQLRNPEGRWGGVCGSAMSLANARANTLAVNAVAEASPKTIVELGCGPGDGLARLLSLETTETILGADHSATMIDRAAKRNSAALAHGRLTLFLGDFARLPLQDESVDAALAVNVAYFMQDRSAVAEARRVLRKNGRLVVYVTHRSHMQAWPFAGSHTHRLFDSTELTALLVDGGFADLTLRRINAGFGVYGLLAVAVKT